MSLQAKIELRSARGYDLHKLGNKRRVSVFFSPDVVILNLSELFLFFVASSHRLKETMATPIATVILDRKFLRKLALLVLFFIL